MFQFIDPKSIKEKDPSESFIDLFDCDDGIDLEEVKRKQDEEFDFSGKILGSQKDCKQKKRGTLIVLIVVSVLN